MLYVTDIVTKINLYLLASVPSDCFIRVRLPRWIAFNCLILWRRSLIALRNFGQLRHLPLPLQEACVDRVIKTTSSVVHSVCIPGDGMSPWIATVVDSTSRTGNSSMALLGMALYIKVLSEYRCCGRPYISLEKWSEHKRWFTSFRPLSARSGLPTAIAHCLALKIPH